MPPSAGLKINTQNRHIRPAQATAAGRKILRRRRAPDVKPPRRASQPHALSSALEKPGRSKNGKVISVVNSNTLISLAFERQRGVHAIGSDGRQDFDAWPGDLAYTSPNVNIFSESMTGGEYLALHVARSASELVSDPPLAAPRLVFHGDRRAVCLGWRLRLLQFNYPTAVLCAAMLPINLQSELQLLLGKNHANLSRLRFRLHPPHRAHLVDARIVQEQPAHPLFALRPAFPRARRGVDRGRAATEACFRPGAPGHLTVSRGRPLADRSKFAFARARIAKPGN
jgi:hypothetical protein